MFRLSIRAFILVLIVSFNAGRVLAGSAGEYEIKAAFLYKFAQFTRWPTPATGQFTICVLGKNPFEEALQNLDGKKLNDVNVVTKHPDSLADAKICQVLFLNPANRQQLKQWQAGLQGLPILTISDDPAGWDSEVMIIMITEVNRIGFNINRTAAQKIGMDFRAQLLQLARMLR